MLNIRFYCKFSLTKYGREDRFELDKMTSYDLRVSCKCNGKDASRRGCQHPKEQPSSFLQAGKAVVERTEVADRDQQRDEDDGEGPVDFSELEEQLAQMSLLRPVCSKLKKKIL